MSTVAQGAATQPREAKVLARVRSRVLPPCPPVASRAGSGTGHLCHACDERIVLSEIEIDCESPSIEQPTIRLHVRCFLALVAHAARLPRPR